MGILSPSLSHFPVSTLLLSKFPLGYVSFQTKETQGVLEHALLSEDKSAGCLYCFYQTTCGDFFFIVMQLLEFFFFLVTLMFPFVNQGKAFGYKSLRSDLLSLFFQYMNHEQLQETVFLVLVTCVVRTIYKIN